MCPILHSVLANVNYQKAKQSSRHMSDKAADWPERKKNKALEFTFTIWDCFCEKGPNACFSRSLKCRLHIASYTLRIRISVMEL